MRLKLIFDDHYEEQGQDILLTPALVYACEARNGWIGEGLAIAWLNWSIGLLCFYEPKEVDN